MALAGEYATFVLTNAFEEMAVGVRMETPEGVVVIPRTIETIRVPPDRYQVTFRVPETPGTYLVLWDYGEDAASEAIEVTEQREERTPWDALRSLKRYVAEVFPAYEVRMAEEPGTFDRPFAAISEREGVDTLPTRSVTWVDVRARYEVRLFPPPDLDPVVSKQQAFAARERLWNAFEVGVGVGAPRRVPFLSYAGLDPYRAAAPSGRITYLRVEDHSATALPDADDQTGTLFEVVASVRLGWRRRGRLPSGPVVQTFDVRPAS